MRKNTNTEHIEGRLYQHSLEVKTVKNQSSPNFGKNFIGGNIDIAVDDAGLNVVTVEFTYVTETNKNGSANRTYGELVKIINSGKTVLKDGMENATMISIDASALALNDFVGQDDSMVSVPINRGGFVTIVNQLKPENERSTFKVDFLITGVKRVEADPERYIMADYVVLRGAAFSFNNALLPMEFVVKNPQGMQYFENLDVTGAEPVYTQVWGKISFANQAIQETVESAFGEPSVSTRDRKVKEWIVTGASKVPYDFGDENIMTVEEVVKAQQDREVYLADVRKRRDEYMAQKNSTPAPSAFGGAAVPTPAAPIAAGAFKF